ncbi:hypothetical protein JRO89_XS13G0205900 [Xanthoceras sorbifolium]|uniref:MYB transcription factor n=1 Tax=Xanthoceras sorbifolium TaxID=99658 RepID=A0ABQ8H9A3_9ROSI|nr:hypothetical protein JRO89_XS13G0205900 [Xanthoceras sorbifolium]
MPQTSKGAQEPTFLLNDDNYSNIIGVADASTKEHQLILNKQVYDPFSYFEFQAGSDHQSGYSNNNSNLISQYHASLRPVDHHQNQFETNSNFAFSSSIPSLTAFHDQGNMSGADFSENSAASRVSCFFLNDQAAAKESSSTNSTSNMSNNYTGFQMNNLVENAGFSWDIAENKLNSMYHFHHHVNNGIKSEEMSTPSSWHDGQLHTQNNSVDFSSYPTLTSLSEDLAAATFDVFHQIS